MKVALITDLHLGYKENTVQSKMMYGTLDHFFEYVKNNQIKNIFVLGDIFNCRTNIDFMTIKNTYEHFINPIINQDIKAFIIAGNHDCYFKNTNDLYSVELLFSHVKNLHLVKSNPEEIILENTSFGLVPWICSENFNKCMDFINTSNCDYLLGHFEINSFTMVKGVQCKNGISVDKFKKFKKVFSGHFHINDDKKNICYIGTPYEKDWNDRASNKGFYILDLDNGKYDYIKNNDNFHITIEYNNGFNINDLNSLKDKNVKVIVNNIEKQSQFDKDIIELQLINPYKLSIIENTQTSINECIENTMSNDNVVFSENDNIKLIENYTDLIETDLDKTKLKDLFIEIYNESLAK